MRMVLVLVLLLRGVNIAVAIVVVATAVVARQALATAAAAIPAPLVGPLAVQALQILPPIACQAAFLAPLDTMRKIQATGTTGELPLIPYASMFLNGVLWITYGLLKASCLSCVFVWEWRVARGRSRSREAGRSR